MPLRHHHHGHHHHHHHTPIDGLYTPVSPSHLEPLSTRFQQVSLSELAFINDHLINNDISRSGWSTPLASSALGAGSSASVPGSASATGDGYFPVGFQLPAVVVFDEEDDKRAEIRADAERPFPVDRRVLKDLIEQHMHSPVIRMQFLSSGASPQM